MQIPTVQNVTDFIRECLLDRGMFKMSDREFCPICFSNDYNGFFFTFVPIFGDLRKLVVWEIFHIVVLTKCANKPMQKLLFVEHFIRGSPSPTKSTKTGIQRIIINLQYIE